MAITSALSDPNRVRILQALRAGELCVCQITEFLGLSPSTASKHLSVLKAARLVEARKEGRWMYYSSAGDAAPPPAREALEWLRRSLVRDPQVKADRERLKAVLQEDPEEICRRQMGKPACCPAAPRSPVEARRSR
jgi:ArsR family transcriptional regulator